jgi:hypothetical protein
MKNENPDIQNDKIIFFVFSAHENENPDIQNDKIIFLSPPLMKIRISKMTKSFFLSSLLMNNENSDIQMSQSKNLFLSQSVSGKMCVSK